MKVRRVFVRTFSFLILCLALSAAALAQQTGSIQGRVTDGSGGVLPGVTVEAKSSVLPATRTTVSGADGIYQLPALPPGSYTLTFTLSGFQTATSKGEVQLASV